MTFFSFTPTPTAPEVARAAEIPPHSFHFLESCISPLGQADGDVILTSAVTDHLPLPHLVTIAIQRRCSEWALNHTSWAPVWKQGTKLGAVTPLGEVYSVPQSIDHPDQLQSIFRDAAAWNQVPPIRTGLEDELDFTEDGNHIAPESTGIAAAGRDKCPVIITQGLGSSTSAMTEPRFQVQAEEESVFMNASAVTEPT